MARLSRPLIAALALACLPSATPFAPSSARAADAPPAPVLSLEDALALAEHSAPVRVAKSAAEADRARVNATRRPANPLLGLGTTRYSGNRLITFSQDIRWAGQRGFAVASAEHDAEAAALDARQAAAEARHEARARWLGLARAEDASLLADEVTARVRGLRDAIAAKVEGGRAPRLDLVRADAETKSLEAAAAAASEERAAAWAFLAGLLELPEDARGRTDGDRPQLAPLAELEAAADPAHAERQPAVIAARARLAAAESSVALAGRQRLPGLNLEVGATAGDPGLPGTDASAMLTLALPVGAGPVEAIAIADRDAARARLEDAVRRARSDLAAAHHHALGARAALASYDASAVPAAEEAASLTRESFDAGRGDLLRVLEAGRALLDVRAARLEAYIGSQLAWGDLLLAAGSEHGAD